MLARLPEERLFRELDLWLERGVVPEPDPARPELVGVIWQSPVFQVLMGAIGFWPPDNLDLRPHLAHPYRSLSEFARARLELHGHCSRGALARGELAYWQVALQLQAPQLYLEPFLPPQGPLQGCDLACGWGRICLALTEYRQRSIQACDLSWASLRRLTKLAERRGLAEAIVPCRADVTSLPFADTHFDFFLAFDIFEHLTDEVLDRCLRETLRCARVGAVLYAEIPLQAYCPALTHVQNWTQAEVTARFEKLTQADKGWELALWSPFVPEHFTFRVVSRLGRSQAES